MHPIPSSPARRSRLAPALVAFAILLLAPLARADGLHHIHLRATDTKAAADWYAERFDGAYERVIDTFDAAVFGDVKILFLQTEPGFGGSVGTAMDHIGFSFPDLAAKMKEFEADGVKIVAPIVKLPQIEFAFVEDPWGTKIEVMRDPDLYGFHHLHLMSDNPPATIDWYAEALGGEKEVYQKILHSIRYENFWLIVQPTPKELAGTDGRSIDHFGWGFADLDAAAMRFREKGATFLEEPHAFGPSRKAVALGPFGMKIELVEWPPTEPGAAPAESDAGNSN